MAKEVPQLPLQWGQTSNPEPREGATVTWTVLGGDGTDISWSAKPASASIDAVIDLKVNGKVFTEPIGPFVTLEVMKTGNALITATQGDRSISRYVAVGRMLAFSPDGMLWGVDSQHWVPVPTSPDIQKVIAQQPDVASIPDKQPLTTDDQCLVSCYLLNMGALFTKRDDESSKSFWFAESPTDPTEE